MMCVVVYLSQVISATNGIGGEEYSVHQQVGISIAVLITWSALNALRVDEQGIINNFSAIWQMSSTTAIVVCILAYPSERNTSEFVWFSTNNDTGFPESHFGYVCLLGLLTSTFSFSGYEAGAHMAEETKNASKVGWFYSFDPCTWNALHFRGAWPWQWRHAFVCL